MLRIGQQAAHFLEAVGGLFQFQSDRGFHGRNSYSGAMMPDSPRASWQPCAARQSLFCAAAGCRLRLRRLRAAAAHACRGTPKGESESMMAAENALRDGDCRGARRELPGRRAGQQRCAVCRRAPRSWPWVANSSPLRALPPRAGVQLDPYSGDAALAAALVALKRYDLAEARTALTAWRDSGSAGSQDPLRFAELLAAGNRCHRGVPGVPRSAGGRGSHGRSAAGQARLALAAQNMRAAMDGAQRALQMDSDLTEAQVIVLRALSVLGEHDAAIEGARALDAAQLQGEDVFLLADLLIAADRHDEARRELAAPGRAAAKPALGAERRLIALRSARGRFRCGREAAGAAAGRAGHHGDGAALSWRSWPSGAAMTRAPCRATGCWPTARWR